MQCVVCGRETNSNHKCPKRVEAARQAAETKAINEQFGDYETPKISENIRLWAGLALMEKAER